MQVVIGEKSRISQRVIDIHQIITSCSFAGVKTFRTWVKKYQTFCQSRRQA
jgi:hypothetical protein